MQKCCDAYGGDPGGGQYTQGWAGRGNKRRQCRGIACAEGNCAVELVAAGVATRQTRAAETFGLRNGPHVNLVLNDVELPADELIGKEGNGLRQAMVTQSNRRTLAASISLGLARSAFDESFPYVSGRTAFGGKIIDFQSIQWYFAEAAAELDAARLIPYQAARDLDSGGDFQRSSSATKLLASTLATKIASMAVQEPFLMPPVSVRYRCTPL